MKKILLIVALVLGGIYGTGYVSLSEGGANRFLNKMEALTMEGDAKRICDLFADDLQVKLNDHTAGGGKRGKFSGGKQEFCDYYKLTAPAMSMLQASTTVQRQDFVVKRDVWLHPWTANVTFTELRSMRFQAAGVSMDTESDDQMVLVRTLGGVKIKRLESEIWAQE